jgi:uncharacterized membrane protein YgcG
MMTPTQAAPVAVGDAFTSFQRQELEKVVADAERYSGCRFSVYVGPAGDDPRATAERMHAGLSSPAESIVIVVDPASHSLEVVTGSTVRETLTNRKAALAALSMQTAFATGDLERGLRAGIQQLAEQAKAEVSLHTDTP